MSKNLVKTLIFTVLVPGTVTVVVPYRLLASGARPQSTLGLVGILPIALGAALYLWCAWDFASAGRGTPALVDPPKALVSGGPYRVVRNPMYVGVLLILLGEGIVFGSQTILRYALLAWLFFYLFVVFYGSALDPSPPPRQPSGWSALRKESESFAWLFLWLLPEYQGTASRPCGAVRLLCLISNENSVPGNG